MEGEDLIEETTPPVTAMVAKDNESAVPGFGDIFAGTASCQNEQPKSLNSLKRPASELETDSGSESNIESEVSEDADLIPKPAKQIKTKAELKYGNGNRENGYNTSNFTVWKNSMKDSEPGFLDMSCESEKLDYESSEDTDNYSADENEDDKSLIKTILSSPLAPTPKDIAPKRNTNSAKSRKRNIGDHLLATSIKSEELSEDEHDDEASDELTDDSDDESDEEDYGHESRVQFQELLIRVAQDTITQSFDGMRRLFNPNMFNGPFQNPNSLPGPFRNPSNGSQQSALSAAADLLTASERAKMLGEVKVQRERPRKSLSLQEKVDIIKALDGAKQNSKSHRQIAIELGLARSTLGTIFKCRDKILNQWYNNVSGTCKRICDSPFVEIENELDEWMCERGLKPCVIEASKVVEKALDIAERMRQYTFKGSNGWLFKFMRRHRRRCHEKLEVREPFPAPVEADYEPLGAKEPPGEKEPFSVKEPSAGREPSGANEPFVKEPFVKEPFVKEPFVKEPFVKEPFDKEPFVKEPSTEPQDEDESAEEPEDNQDDQACDKPVKHPRFSQCRRPRNFMTLERKMEILRHVDENTQSRSKLAAEFGIAKSTLSDIIKYRKKITDAWCSGGRGKCRIAKSPYQQIDNALYSWICERRALHSDPITGKVMQEKALEIAKALGLTSFTGSNGWLHGFKDRHRLLKTSILSTTIVDDQVVHVLGPPPAGKPSSRVEAGNGLVYK